MISYLTEAQHPIRAKETGDWYEYDSAETSPIFLAGDQTYHSNGTQISVIWTRQVKNIDNPLLAYDPPIISSGAEKGIK